jgi:hypothetical protein
MGLLEGVRKGRNPRPPKVVVYGGPKVGKSTFGASIPNAIFVQTEEGLDALDVHAFPLAASYADVRNAIVALAKEEHAYKAIVLDSLDWLEPLIWDHVCKQAGVESIEQVGGGYGKGYGEALKVWRQFLDGLDYLRDHKRMSVVLIAHDEIRKFEPVDSEPYDYAALKLHKKAAGLIEEWADVIGYAKLRTLIRTEDKAFGAKHSRAVALGDVRELHVGQNPAYVSGNRYGLPDVLPLEWSALSDALRAPFTAPTNEVAQ